MKPKDADIRGDPGNGLHEGPRFVRQADIRVRLRAVNARGFGPGRLPNPHAVSVACAHKGP